jgi:tetratricopeptide (TPR) repeat protein
MAYVRKRGNHLALVQGQRDPVTKKVEQQVLFTIYSKAEALEILGETRDGAGKHYFQHGLEEKHPRIRFDWQAIGRAIRQHMDGLPDLHDYRQARLRSTFHQDLTRFTSRLLITDPQWLLPASKLICEHRHELEFLRELIDWRLSLPEQKEDSFNTDNPFYWRLAFQEGQVPVEAEEMAVEHYDRGDNDRARAVFQLLIDSFEDYAEGHNYLGLIALREDDVDAAIEHFERTVEVGRRLFPGRIAKERWWTDLATRPYMRGLANLALSLNQAGRHDEALEVCDRLEGECGDDLGAAAHRAAAYLCQGAWEQARDAALRVCQIDPSEGLTAALAAYELGDRDGLKTWFVHAALNAPHTVGMVLGKRMPRPEGYEAARDHNSGITARRELLGFLSGQRAASRRYFTGLWKRTEDLRTELDRVTRRWSEARGSNDRSDYDRMMELKSVDFARRWPQQSGGRR